MPIRGALLRRLPMLILAIFVRGQLVAVGCLSAYWILIRPVPPDLARVGLGVLALGTVFAIGIGVFRVLPSYEAIMSLSDLGRDMSSEVEGRLFIDRMLSKYYVLQRKNYDKESKP